MEDLIDQIREDIAARLRADEIISGISVVTERSGDPNGEVDAALGLVEGSPGSRGLCLVVLQMTARPETEEIPNPVLILQPVVRVMEHPVVNDSDVTAVTLARRVLRVLHHYQPAGLASCLVADSPALVGVKDDFAPLAYDVSFRCMEDDVSPVEKVATPRIWPDEGTATSSSPIAVSIACDTPEAEILYTVDGSPPYRGNAAAQPYSAPITIDGACLVRAAAWKTGCITSDTAATRFD
jgi:hypothetical protein